MKLIDNSDLISTKLVKMLIKKRQKGGNMKILNNILIFLKDKWYIFLIIIFVIILLIIRLKDKHNKKRENDYL